MEEEELLEHIADLEDQVADLRVERDELQSQLDSCQHDHELLIQEIRETIHRLADLQGVLEGAIR